MSRLHSNFLSASIQGLAGEDIHMFASVKSVKSCEIPRFVTKRVHSNHGTMGCSRNHQDHLTSRSTWLKPVKDTATNLQLGCLGPAKSGQSLCNSRCCHQFSHGKLEKLWSIIIVYVAVCNVFYIYKYIYFTCDICIFVYTYVHIYIYNWIQ